MNIIEGSVIASDSRLAVVVVRFNQFINDILLTGAIDVLKRIGQVKEENITVVWVPGSYELPLIIDVLAEHQKYDAIIALGSIIRGHTSHFSFIATECCSGLSMVARKNRLPVVFGVLTTDTIEQAIERSGIKGINKGAEAALTALESINVLKAIKYIDN